MSTAPTLDAPTRVEDPDQRVILNGIDWWQFETFLAIRGDRAGVRVTYLEGELEIMSPSRTHEMVKTMIARLLEAYADEKGFIFEGYGSLTMRNAPKLRGIEPDECYAVGAAKESPDLAVEVLWTHGGIDKLEVYRGLGVREVWIWKKNDLKAYALRGGAYVEIPQSEVIPGLSPAFIGEFLDCETQTDAVRKMRAALRK
ncbi:MAG TPA: Uma2 family endonuclease [Thermoanaerobaculia bacterium]|nr:Uma2 family endonuclease [Thermoanaerobaculia bacterium]